MTSVRPASTESADAPARCITWIVDGDGVLSAANEAGITIVGREIAKQPAGRSDSRTPAGETTSGR